MADRHHDVIAAQLAYVCETQSAHVALLDYAILDALTKSKLTTERIDARASVLDHLDQAERADMRLAGGEDFLRRASIDELVQDLSTARFRVLDLAYAAVRSFQPARDKNVGDYGRAVGIL